jgi:hypothetical protein
MSADDGDEERSAEFREAFGRTMKSLEDAIDRISFDTHFSDRGMEFPTTVEFAD